METAYRVAQRLSLERRSRLWYAEGFRLFQLSRVEMVVINSINVLDHIAVTVSDMDRSLAFYHDVFGWTFQRYEGAPAYYGLATTGESNPGINGALFKRWISAIMESRSRSGGRSRTS